MDRLPGRAGRDPGALGAPRASSAAALHSTIGLDAEIDYDKLTQDIVYRKGGVNQIVNNFRDVVAKNLATTLRRAATVRSWRPRSAPAWTRGVMGTRRRWR